jgi:hypothetical protein
MSTLRIAIATPHFQLGFEAWPRLLSRMGINEYDAVCGQPTAGVRESGPGSNMSEEDGISGP